MSTLMDQLLDPARRAECARHDRLSDAGDMALADRKPLLPLKDKPPAESVRSGEGSLSGVTQSVERIAIQPHYWPQDLVPWRTDRVPLMDRRTGPRGSRFGDLQHD